MKIKLTVTRDELIERYKKHTAQWTRCVRCKIGELAHNHVLARGEIPCDLLFIGEAPGKTEDATGFPFVGRAGQLLDRWIAASNHGYRYAITNLVLCRPCDGLGLHNREPTPLEVDQCHDRLIEFINIASPKAVVTVGAWARRNVPNFKGLWRLELVHPAAILRLGGESSPENQRQVDKLTDFVTKVLC